MDKFINFKKFGCGYLQMPVLCKCETIELLLCQVRYPPSHTPADVTWSPTLRDVGKNGLFAAAISLSSTAFNNNPLFTLKTAATSMGIRAYFYALYGKLARRNFRELHWWIVCQVKWYTNSKSGYWYKYLGVFSSHHVISTIKQKSGAASKPSDWHNDMCLAILVHCLE